MLNKELRKAKEQLIEETKEALQTVYDALNQGQKKKIVKNESVKALFDRYGVEYE
jgi:hypothetical protein